MGIFFLLVVAVACIVLWYVIARKMSEMAEAKGHDRRSYFHWCFWTGIWGFLIVFALPDLTVREQNKELLKALERMNTNAAMPSAEQKNGWNLPSL